MFPYTIYDHLKCVSRLRATLYKVDFLSKGSVATGIVGLIYLSLEETIFIIFTDL